MSESRSIQLMGVVCASLQSALGEASCLALSSHFDGVVSITAWSSGTGFAGVFGYGWIAVLHVMLGMSFGACLMAALILPVSWIVVYFVVLDSPDGRKKELRALYNDDLVLAESTIQALQDQEQGENEMAREEDRLLVGNRQSEVEVERMLTPNRNLTIKDRFILVMGLWPYTIPLFLVYFAEYAMQSGVWPSIGFPVEQEDARHTFYVYSNWAYQAGVFISRSSGTIWQAERNGLWIMPMLQVGCLAFFISVALLKFWYNWLLLLPCTFSGLLGGAVYVNAFSLISREVRPEHKEFSLAAASVADSTGIALADCVGILLQGCLFKYNNIPGADFSC